MCIYLDTVRTPLDRRTDLP